MTPPRRKAGADPNAKDYDHRNALMLAASNGNLAICKYLLLHGASARAKDRWEHTAADEAERQGHTGIILELLRDAEEKEPTGMARPPTMPEPAQTPYRQLPRNSMDISGRRTSNGTIAPFPFERMNIESIEEASSRNLRAFRNSMSDTDD